MKILGILASAALAALVGTGLYLRFGLQVLDRPGMENPAAPMLELLSAQWTSEDGVWSARIEGETLDLSYQQDLVYSGSFFFGFNGDDLNIKTELDFYNEQFESEDGSVSSTIESLYVENCRLHLDITVSKAGEGSPLKMNRGKYGRFQKWRNWWSSHGIKLPLATTVFDSTSFVPDRILLIPACLADIWTRKPMKSYKSGMRVA